MRARLRRKGTMRDKSRNYAANLPMTTRLKRHCALGLRWGRYRTSIRLNSVQPFIRPQRFLIIKGRQKTRSYANFLPALRHQSEASAEVREHGRVIVAIPYEDGFHGGQTFRQGFEDQSWALNAG